MEGGAPAECVAGGAPDHVVEIAQTPETCLGFKQVMSLVTLRSPRSTGMQGL